MVGRGVEGYAVAWRQDMSKREVVGVKENECPARVAGTRQLTEKF
jgi:hypothetical protein